MSRPAAFVRIAPLALALGLGGCMLLPRPMPEPTDAQASPAARGNAIVASTLGKLTDVAASHATQCEKAADQAHEALARAVAKTLHDSPRPGVVVEPPSVLFERLRKDGVTLTLRVDPGTGVPHVTDTLAEERERWRVPPQDAKEEAERAKLTSLESKASFRVDALRAEVGLFSQAFVQARSTGAQCRSLTNVALWHTWASDRSGLTESGSRGRAAIQRMLQATRRAAALEAVTAALFGSFQAAASHDHPEAVDEAIAALEKSMPIDVKVSQEEADRQVAELTRVIEAQDAKRRAANPAVAAMAGAPQQGGAGSAADLIALLPPGSPLRGGAECGKAIVDGNYKKAVLDAGAMVPGPVGTVFKSFGPLFGG